jgi:opacity protein-like surface antigen
MGGGNASSPIASTDISDLRMSFSDLKIAVSPEQTSPTSTSPNLLSQAISGDNGKTAWYGGVGLGLNSTRFALPIADDQYLKSANVSFDTRSGIGLNGFVGYKFSNFRAEGELLYTSNSIFQGKISGKNASGGSNYEQIEPVTGNISNFSVMLNGYYDIVTGSQFKPFVGVGIGFGSASITTTQRVSPNFFTVPDSQLVAQTDSGSASGLAYQFKVGTAYAISDNTDLYLQYRYLKGPSTFSDGSVSNKADFNDSSFEFGTRFGF